MNELDIFTAALELENPDQRSAFLSEACGDNADLRQRIESLLGMAGDARSFLEHPPRVDSSSEDSATRPSTGDRPGTVIGPYKLLQELGEGGMGTVFMAEQTQPVRRKVALKIIKPGMDSRKVIARFEAERQALALMDHHHIARVLDAGTTETGRPYFVMELVKGVPITSYCDDNKLTVSERLELFVPVCQAIHHAHQKGVIHRDIKPSNVLVSLYDGRPVPKVIDFGIAKATGQQLTDKTMFTEIGQIIGTLEYMSPEQAEINQLDVDTRSDVYSLGVLLYELLTSSTPITRQQLKEAGFTAMLRTIRETEPPKPSTRLSQSGNSLPTISAVRRTEPAKLSRLIRGDLDWIVMKALDKDRGRRYQSAREFAVDVERFLRQDAVEACPPSAGYRLRKFARRNKGPVAVVALLAVVLIGGIAGTSMGLIRARSAQHTALNAASLAERRLVEIGHQQTATISARSDAERHARVAEQNLAQATEALQHAESMRLTAQSSAVLSDNPGLALLLAVEGAERGDPRAAEQNNALLAALDACWESRTFAANAGQVSDPYLNPQVSFTSAQVSHDGRWIAAVSERFTRDGREQSVSWDDKAVHLLDAATGELMHRFQVPGLAVHFVAFSPDDRLLLTTFRGATLVEFADGKQSVFSDHVVRIWNTQTGQEAVVLKGHSNRVITACFSSDGKRVLTASWDKTARIWDTQTGEQLSVTSEHAFSLNAAHFSPDDRTVLTVPSGDKSQSRAHLEGVGKKVKPEPAADPPIRSDQQVAWVESVLNIRSGGRSLSGNHEYTAPRLWNADSGIELFVLGQVGGNTDQETTSAGPIARPVDVSDGETHLHRPTEETLCASFSPNGKYVATGGWLGLVTIWEVATGKPLRHWKHGADAYGNGQRIAAVTFSPDGLRLLVVYSDDQDRPFDRRQDAVTVCDVVNRHELIRWQQFPAGVRAAEFSPDGSRVLILPGNERRQQESDTFRAARGEFLVTLPDDRTVYLRDIESGRDVAVLKGHDADVSSATWHPDGRTAVTSSRDGTVRIWNVGQAPVYGMQLDGHSSSVGLATFSPDGRHALSTCALRHNVTGASGGEPTTRLWDAASGQVRHQLRDNRLPYNKSLQDRLSGAVRHAEFSHDGKRLLTVSHDSFVRRRIDAPGVPEVEGSPPGLPLDELAQAADVRFTPVRLWDVETGQLVLSLSGFAAGVRHASLSPNGTRIVTLSDRHYRYVLVDEKDQYCGEGEHSPHRDAAVRVWDAQNGELLAELLSEDHTAESVVWSPDGRWLFTASYDENGRLNLDYQIWHAHSLQPHVRLDAKPHTRLASILFSPQGDKLLIVSNTYQQDGRAELWNVDDGSKIAELRGHHGNIHAAAFSSDGKRLITGGDDRTARVWESDTGRHQMTLASHQAALHGVNFSPDGQWIATAGEDDTARIWDAESGQAWLTLSGHRGPVFCVAFHPDSNRVITGSGDGTARIWPVDPLPYARQQLPRALTAEERMRFLPKPAAGGTIDVGSTAVSTPSAD